MISAIIATTASALISLVSLQVSVDATGTAIARPVGEAKFDAPSGSYFQVMQFYGPTPHTWEHAQVMVKGYRHKDREGRLAHITTGEIHFFMMLNYPELQMYPMWMGLRVECKDKQGRWTDNTLLREQEFRAWSDTTGKIIRDTCKREGEKSYVPFTYKGSETGGLRWHAVGKRTNVKSMLVEFPDPAKSGK